MLVVLSITGVSASASPLEPEPQAPQIVSIGTPVFIRLDPTPDSYRVPPPRAFSEVRAQSATININYLPAGAQSVFGYDCYTWPSNAVTAFEYAASIWEGLINSSVPIEVDACWTSFGDPDILGAGGTLDFFVSSNVLYPVALANALSGSDLNDTDGDDSDGDGSDADAEVHVAYGMDFDWYYGTDGNPGPQETDFASVVLHEICHGLGFSGSMTVVNGRGYWGLGTSYGLAYDQFAENGSGQALLGFTSGSTELAAQLTSNNLYFDAPNADAANGGTPPKLFAPSTWMQGSSYSHLDYDTYVGTQNTLMVYAISQGVSAHSPGPIAQGMLQDMGWTFGTTAPAPTVTSITPNTGLDTGIVSITNLVGTNFQSGATVKLTKSGESDINATNVNVASDTQITCDLDLTGATAGQWNVVVTNPDAQSGTLSNGFTVTAAPAPDVSIQADVADRDYNPGDPITFTLSFANNGTKEASNVVITDQVPPEVLNPTYDSTVVVTPTGVFSYVWNVEPLGIGESGVIHIYGQLDSSLGSNFSFVNTATISDPEDVTPENNTGSTTVGMTEIYLPLLMRHYPPIPDTPVLNPISNPGGDGNYTVDWNAAALADKYILQEDDNAKFKSPTKRYEGTSTSWSATNKSAGTYYYRVKASNSYGDSGWSSVRSVTVKPPTTFYPVADAFVAQGYPGTNYGNTWDMWAGYGKKACFGTSKDPKINRSLIQFDLSSIPSGTSISEAKLYLYVMAWCRGTSSSPRKVTVYRVKANWSESSVNWNNKPGYGEAYGSTSVSFLQTGKWYTFDVTGLVRKWVKGTEPNRGLMVRAPEGSGSDFAWFGFYTSETSGTSYDPYLKITYTGTSAAEEVPPTAEEIIGAPVWEHTSADVFSFLPCIPDYGEFGGIGEAVCSPE
jgi:uncharacterized repeat protein (TIGR01451 family)